MRVVSFALFLFYLQCIVWMLFEGKASKRRCLQSPTMRTPTKMKRLCLCWAVLRCASLFFHAFHCSHIMYTHLYDLFLFSLVLIFIRLHSLFSVVVVVFSLPLSSSSTSSSHLRYFVSTLYFSRRFLQMQI